MTASKPRAAILLILAATACSGDRRLPTGASPSNACGDYPAQAASEYVLPWPVGLEYRVYTGNCDSGNLTHDGNRRFAYDFRMAPGNTVSAARGGVVFGIQEGHSDDDHTLGRENSVVVQHGDGTFGLYIHIAQNGARVEVGQSVAQGETLALLGTSGSIGPDLVPHLHFEVASQLGSIESIRSLPVTFRNTRPHPTGLAVGESYRAEPY